MHLYYIALVPPHTLKQNICTIQKNLKARYKVAHALKSPPHITLQKPFKRHDTQENRLSSTLDAFATQQSPFMITLQSFSHFNQRVLYIAIKDSSTIISLANKLQTELIKTVQLSTHEHTHITHPHITVAARDMNTTVFSNIWKELQTTHFLHTWIINGICLLKHNGTAWDILHHSHFAQ